MEFGHEHSVGSTPLKSMLSGQTAVDMSEERSFGSADTLNELPATDGRPDEQAEPKPGYADRSTAFLDGLRGFAALCVFIQHYIPGFDMQVHEHGFGQLDQNGQDRHWFVAGLPFVRILFNGGNAAVAIFFVLSGYVLSKSCLRLLRDGQASACRTSLVSAVVRRPIRLYLPVFAVSFITTLVMHLPGPVMEINMFAPPEPTLWKEIRLWWRETPAFFNPFQYHDSDRRPYYYNAVAWTLPIELKGSMFVYALVALYALNGAKPGKGALYCFFLGTALLQLALWSWACFAFGLVLAILDVYGLDMRILEQHYTPRAQSIIHNTCFWLGWYFLSQPAVGSQPVFALNTPGWNTLTRMAPKLYNKHHYYRYWQSWGALLLVYGCLRLEWVRRILHSRALTYLGKVSFMLYLIHLPFFKVWGDRVSKAVVVSMSGGWEEPEHKFWYDRLIRVPDIGPDAINPRFIVAMALNLAVTLPLAHAGTKWIDMPSVRLAKRVSKRLGLDASSSTQEQRTSIALPQWSEQREHGS